MILCVIFFLFGICTLHLFEELPSLSWVIFSIMALLISRYLILKSLKQNLKKSLKKTLKNILTYSFVFIVGFFWVTLHAKIQLDKNLPNTLQGKVLTITGTVASIPLNKPEGQRFEFDVDKLVFPSSNEWRNPGKIQLFYKTENAENIKIKVGDKWQFQVKLKRPRSYANPGSFDIERHFFLNRLVAKGYVLENSEPELLQSSIFSYPIDRLRTVIRDKMDELLRDRKLKGLIPALVVGIKDGITEKQWEVFRDTGTAHLMAISGLHVGLVSGFVFFMVRLVWGMIPNATAIHFLPSPIAASLGAMIGALFYSFLAGFSVPTQRASVMVVLLMIGTLSRRIFSVSRSYFLSLGLVLLWDPLTTLSPGFWLSFGAVGVILYGMRGRKETLWGKWGRAQWVTFVGLIPISLVCFQQVSLVSPLANSITIPWVSFLVVPLALLGTVAMLIHPIIHPVITENISNNVSALFLKLAESLLNVLWPVLEMLQKIPKATWMQAEYTTLTICAASISVFLILLPKGLPVRYLGVFYFLPLIYPVTEKLQSKMVKVTVLDVGQGLSTIIRTQNHVLVYDTGPKLHANFDTGDRVVLPFLATQGIRKVDTLLISHGDNDHAGGAESILKKMPVHQIITSEPAIFNNNNLQNTLKPIVCRRGTKWIWDEVEFEILHPESHQTRKRNEHSCVLRVRAGKQSVLLTGDIEAKSERDLVLEFEPKKLSSTLMLVPHHGSKTSSTLEFIRAVRPEYAIIPVGFMNAYGHPKKEIVERYKNEKISVLSSIEDGAVTFLLKDADEVSAPIRQRVSYRHYWN